MNTVIMDIYNIFKKNYLRYIKYSLVGTIGFFITELLTFLLYPKFPDIVAVLVALSTSTILGYFISKKFVAKVSKGNPYIYVLTSIINIFAMDFGQWLLLYFYSINPIVGNIVVGIVVSPINYVIQMVKVWRVSIGI